VTKLQRSTLLKAPTSYDSAVYLDKIQLIVRHNQDAMEAIVRWLLEKVIALILEVEWSRGQRLRPSSAAAQSP
jgi:hypothetical protein